MIRICIFNIITSDFGKVGVIVGHWELENAFPAEIVASAVLQSEVENIF